MSGTTFTRKIISVTFTLAGGQFQGTNSNTLTVTGLRVWVKIEQTAGVAIGYCETIIYGLTQSQMNQMSTYSAAPGQASPNTIEVNAGDESGLAFVYKGTIMVANADYNQQPDVAFVVAAFAGVYQSVAQAAPYSFAGSADVATIMQSLAAKYPNNPLKLENSGVSVKLTNPYFPGSIGDQIKACAKAANIYALPDLVNGVLAIWPKLGTRNGAIVTVGEDSGLVGYPTFNVAMISFRSIWNPNIICGRSVQLQSSLAPANKKVSPLTIRTELQSETENGAWFMECDCQNLDFYTQS